MDPTSLCRRRGTHGPDGGTIAPVRSSRRLPNYRRSTGTPVGALRPGAASGTDLLPEELGDVRPTRGLVDNIGLARAPFQTQPSGSDDQPAATEDLSHHDGDSDDTEEDDTRNPAHHELKRGVRLVGECEQTDAQYGEDDTSQEHSPLTGGRLWNYQHVGTTQLLGLSTYSISIDTHDSSTPPVTRDHLHSTSPYDEHASGHKGTTLQPYRHRDAARSKRPHRTRRLKSFYTHSGPDRLYRIYKEVE